MDDEGLYLRKNKNFTQKELYELCDEELKEMYMELNDKGNPVYARGTEDYEKELLQENAFRKLTHDEKLRMCNRPEHIKNLSESAWEKINKHLNTDANSFQSLVEQLGMKRFGKRPKIGDVFSGGGSIPFEAARLGADVYASDLNPIASLLTWASLNIAGASDEEVEGLKQFQRKVYDEVDKIVTELKIEHNEKGHRADSYLYCMETVCPECGWKVPLAPSWVIGKGTRTIAILGDNGIDGFDIDIESGASKKDIKNADSYITVRGNNIYCPHCNMETPITSIRGDRRTENGETIYGLRQWEKDEFIPREDDVFQERLYCIRYVSGKVRYYIAPTKEDLQREEKIVNLLSERFTGWQEAGYIPSAKIEEGDKTSEPIRTRGWTYWHQLFNPRQLLINGLFSKVASEMARGQKEKVIGLLGVNKVSDWNSKLSIWNVGSGVETSQNVFTNQALNTLYNYGNRALNNIQSTWLFPINNMKINSNTDIETKDARDNNEFCNIWITDPPYRLNPSYCLS